MDIRSVPLPRLIEADPRFEKVRAYLVDHAEPVRPGSEVHVVRAPLDGLEDVLANAHRAGHVIRGLETAARTLAAEAHGMRLADKSIATPRGARVSRLLLISNDGSDGFYRQVETLLQRHAERVLAVRIGADAGHLGAPLFGGGKTTRALMIRHKVAVADVLLRLTASGEPG